jgi:2-polyprenyl-3-methyl-5-hydroxy-6-metoxy-1,4-benzoquinol methylase
MPLEINEIGIRMSDAEDSSPQDHQSATSTHYDADAENYDQFNEDNSKQVNQTVENILAKYQGKTVRDLTCGTGTQVFWLAKRGYEVSGSDFNTKMLDIAKKKAQEEKLNLTFSWGDMRSVKRGEFDAVITIFNAVGHLTKTDFELAMRNIGANLKKGGVYIFDIFNEVIEVLIAKADAAAEIIEAIVIEKVY